jgi:hypothetical protein
MNSSNAPPPAVPIDQDAFCIRCQYNLRGAAETRCPECGTPFDPAKLSTSLIPWVNRKGIGRGRAFWRMIWQVTFGPRRLLLPEIARDVNFRDGRRFRWTVLAVLLVGSALICGIVALGLADCHHLNDTNGFILLLGAPAIAAAVAVWTGTACWFAMPKRLDETRRRRACALVEYTIAPGVLLLVPAALIAISLGESASGTGMAYEWQWALLAVAILLMLALVVAWWYSTLSIICRLTDRRGSGKFVIGLILALASPLLTLLAVGLPILAVFYWLIMYYSLNV